MIAPLITDRPPNQYTAAVDQQSQYILDMMNFIVGDKSIDDIISGKDVMEYIKANPAYTGALNNVRTGALQSELQGDAVQRSSELTTGAFERPSSRITSLLEKYRINGGLPVAQVSQMKVAAERLCRDYVERGLDITVIRPRTILGHGRLGIFQMLFEWIREGRNVPVMGTGDNRFQFVHALDLADASILAAQRPGPQVYNIGTDRFGTMREVLESLCRHAGTGSAVKGVPDAPVRWLMAGASRLGLSPLGAYHYMAYGKPNYFDISDAVTELGWRPTYSNEEAMIASYDWYLENRDAVLSSKWTASPHKSAVKQGILRLAVRLL